MHLITIGVCTCGKRGTLINGRCGFCDDASASDRQDDGPKIPAPMTVTRAIDLLLAELAEDCPQPLTQRLTLASVAADLCRLAGEPIPAAVLDALDGVNCAPTMLRPTERRGSFRVWEEQFYEPA